jgi:hypothetical protein
LTRQAYALLPHVKVTDLLLEVDRWTRFTDDFTHLKSQEPAKDQPLLLTVILADAINLGLHKMAEACPGTSIANCPGSRLGPIRDETYSKALVRLVNHQHRQPFAAHWGEGTTSSSDGQQFRAGGRGEQAGQVNLRYGTEPGVLFYTHVSDQYAPFHTKVINATVRDATHVLDGLLYHESDLKIEEHYTDTAGFTDHVFALCHLLGFRFAPRIRDLADRRLYVPDKGSRCPALGDLIGGTLSVRASFPVTIHVANRSRANACVRSHSSIGMPSPPQSPRSAFMLSRLMYAHCSRSTILRARVVLPENESPHIKYNVFILRVYFHQTTTSSAAAHAGGKPKPRHVPIHPTPIMCRVSKRILLPFGRVYLDRHITGPGTLPGLD